MLPTKEKPDAQIESDELYVDDREEPSELDTEALFLKLKGWYGTDLEHSLKWRKMAKEAYDFAAGKQWNQEDRAALEDQGRPCITFNRIQSIIRAIAGIEINGRHETVYLPRGTLPGAVKANELLSACSQWMSDNCDAEDEQSTAFQDTIICGMGWCLTGEAMVRLPKMHFATVRQYSGVVVDIELENGQRLTGTSNHPVLTDRGWKKLSALNEGDNLITSDFLKRIDGLSMEQFDQVEARLEDKINSFSAGCEARRFSTASNDFYSDGIGSKIHVVWADSSLWRKFDNTALVQKFKKSSLILWNALSETCVSLFGYGLNLHSGRSAECNLSVCVGHAPGSKFSGGNNIPQLVSGETKALADCLAINSETVSDLVRREVFFKIEPSKVFNRCARYWTSLCRSKFMPAAQKPGLDSGVRYSNLVSDFRDWKPVLEIEARNLFCSGTARPEFVTRVKSRIVRSVHNLPVYDVGTNVGFFIAGNIVTSNTEATMSYDLDPDGAYDERRIDPLEMVWDRSARSKNVADARRVFRVRKMSLNEAREMFPDEDDADLDAPWAETGITSSADIQVIEERRKKRSETNGPDRNDDVHIVHCQWYEKECFYRVADPMSGEILDLGEDEYKTLESRAQEAGIPIKAVKQHRRQYKQCFLGAKVLGEVLEGPCPKGFSWNCITGELDHNAGTFYGPTSLMLDPQRWANKWLSSTLHILNTTAKGGIIAEADAFKDQRQAQDTYAQPDAITWAAKGAISGGKIMQKPGAGVPSSYVQLMEFAISSIRDVTGVNLELLGMRDANQAGILEAQRKQAAMTILATLFDSLRRFRKQVGRVRLHYIQNYLSDGRLIRVAGEDGMQAVALVRDQTAGEYEVIVDDAPTSPNAKQETWAVIQQVIPAFRELLTPDSVVAILEYSPLPSKLVDAFKEMAAKSNAPNPEAEKQKMLEIENAVATIAKTKAAADKDTASAEATRAKGLLDLANAGAQIAAQLQAAVGNMMTPEPWVGPTIEPSYAIDPTFDQSAMPPPLPQVPQMPMGPQPMGPQPQPEPTLMNGGLPQ